VPGGGDFAGLEYGLPVGLLRPGGDELKLRPGAASLTLALLGALAWVAATPAVETVLVHRTVVVGRSVDGRPITAIEIGDPAASDKALVVGCIHGTECAGIAVANRLTAMAARPGFDLWVVPDLNPDGDAAGMRGNAHGVDLNRNFPWRWKHLKGVFFSGPRPLSEPESRFVYHLILRIRPKVSIWFHQHLDVVDESGGSLAVEREFAAVAGLPLKRLAREPGSVVGWENHLLRSGTAFVVELPAGALSLQATARLTRAVLAVTGGAGSTRSQLVSHASSGRIDGIPSAAFRAFLAAARG